MQVTVLEQQPASTLAAPPADGREIALTHPSVATLQRIGSWQRLAAHEVGLLREAQVHDGPVGQRGAMQLHAGGSGVQHLGWIVPNHALRRTAYEVAAHTPGVRLVTEARVTRVAVTPAHAELEYTDTRNLDAAPLRLQAPLLVAIGVVDRLETVQVYEGDQHCRALARALRQLGIGASMNDFGRTVIVCRLRHELPHHEVAHECFGYEQTLAILPLPGDLVDGAPMCSAVVTTGAAHAQELASQEQGQPESQQGIESQQQPVVVGEQRGAAGSLCQQVEQYQSQKAGRHDQAVDHGVSPLTVIQPESSDQSVDFRMLSWNGLGSWAVSSRSRSRPANDLSGWPSTLLRGSTCQ